MIYNDGQEVMIGDSIRVKIRNDTHLLEVTEFNSASYEISTEDYVFDIHVDDVKLVKRKPVKSKPYRSIVQIEVEHTKNDNIAGEVAAAVGDHNSKYIEVIAFKLISTEVILSNAEAYAKESILNEFSTLRPEVQAVILESLKKLP